ncbi:odorant receptor Or2-like [Pseudomyrmex gracilis]|uniref:odorant receptor Or2-like n=1 Tax=Pseudomyrmex gracilis TaxID=219809 RepID=UPI0009951BE7|nr:odorant receptor Or2-like [Pseudomyrmex gracilis]
MEYLGRRYYKLTRIFTLPFGLWPFNDSFAKPIQAFFCVSLLLSAILVQVIRLFTMEYDLVLILTDVSFIIPFSVYLLKYNTLYINSRKIRNIIKIIENNWNKLKDEREVEIVRKHANDGKKFMYFFAGLAYPGVVCFLVIEFSADILDFVAPLNESRPRNILFVTEYFVDQQRYFYLIVCHMTLAATIGLVSVITDETFFFAYIHYICGIFEVVGYRIQHSLNCVSAANKEKIIRMNIIDAIESHKKIIELFEYVMEAHKQSYFVLMILGVASLSVNLLRFFQTLTISDQRKQLVIYMLFIIGHFYYMFILQYMGQKITNSSIQVHVKAYDTQWYAAPVQIQKLLLFIMQRSMKSCKFFLGYIFPVSLEHFTTLASTSVSYFTIIYSVQE